MKTESTNTQVANTGAANTQAANTEDLLQWAAHIINDWENHEQYRVADFEKEIWELNGWGRQPEKVWIARGIMEIIRGEAVGECRIAPFLQEAA